MSEETSSAKNKKGPLLWSVVAIVFVMLECALIYSRIARHSYRSLSWFFYQPVLLALPLLTSLALYRRLKDGSEISCDPSTLAYVSYALALLTLVSYLTLWIAVGDLL
jgi:hypothetical protein